MKGEGIPPRSSFVMPLPGSLVAMVCEKCGWHGFAQKPGLGIPEPKCPRCGRRSLAENSFVCY